jgi:hypothetical protein
MALVSLLFEFVPTAAAAEEGPLPGAFLEFLADMVEEDGELMDPLVLVPEPLRGELEPVTEPAGEPPTTPTAAPEEASGAEPAEHADRQGTGGLSHD